MNKLMNNELGKYLNLGIQNIISEVLKHSMKNSKEAAFLLKFSMHSKKSEKIRNQLEEDGKHIPAFLISSITTSCNLYCKGCYARGNGTCGDEKDEAMLSAAEWEGIFGQASELGISFHLLAGGEPLLRRDVIKVAANYKNTVFPIFTNGTMIDEEYVTLFDDNRNLVPVLSIEGNEHTTDERRGAGVHKVVSCKMDEFHNRGILFISFLGDEKSMGGCLTAGRGFFHVNPYGAAEACPFSPYSDSNLKNTTLRKALESSFFKNLQDEGLVGGEHTGGCALFERKERVIEILNGGTYGFIEK